MLKKNILILSLILIFSNSFAETYYISNSGNDTFDGLSSVFPLKTLDKLNELIVKLKPGDAVLFQRGSVFYGQININSSGDENYPIIFGAYGEGKNPVISGSVPVTNWTKYKGNIYSSEITGTVKNLLANDNQMILARYPNKGYLTIDNPLSDPKKGFTDKELKQAEGYWEGSVARIRTINWAYENISIKYYKNSSLLFSEPTNYPVLSGFGYYLDNNLNELDTAGEWFYLKNKNGKGTIYFYPPSGSDVNNLNIQASIYDYGILSYKNIKNIKIQGLEIRNQNIAGIYFPVSSSILNIENCTFKDILQFGISVSNGSDNNFNNCRFKNINSIPLILPNSKKTKISNNVIKNTGIIPGYGATGGAYQMSAIYIYGTSNKITGNIIDSVGYGAINCHGSGIVIEKNVIKNCLLLLNDGGAIKCWGDYSKNSTWQNNFIFNTKGNIENTSKTSIVALGLYLDDLTNDMTIINNTIVKSGLSGIGINDGFNNLIKNNICFDNPAGVNFFQNLNSKNNRIIKNVIVGKNNEQNSLDLRYIAADFLPGKFDSNYYFNPGNINSFSIIYKNVLSELNFEKWKTFVRSDIHSKLITGIEVSFPKLLTNMSDDSLTILLNPVYNYKDINLNSVHGSMVLQPWSSAVVFVNSNISTLAEIGVAGGPLKFGNSDESNSSIPLWYNLIGENLSDPMIVTAPDGFEVSLNCDSDFGNGLSLSPINGRVDKIIFVRFIPDKEKGYYDFILNKSGNLVSGVKVTGNSR